MKGVVCGRMSTKCGSEAARDGAKGGGVEVRGEPSWRGEA